MKRLFTAHPATVGESYGEHLVSATSFSWRMMVGASACLVHAFFPFLFERTGSRIIETLYDRMILNRSRIKPATQAPGSGLPSRS